MRFTRPLNISMVLVIGLLTGVLFASQCWAGRVRVAADGSGDYETLFDGIAAAASGDTVSVGPGVYDDFVEIAPSGIPVDVLGWVTQSQLTILGDDRDHVIIGPSTPAANLETGGQGIATWFDVSLTVRHVTIRNVGDGLQCNGDRLVVSDCILVGNYQGIDSIARLQTDVRGCHFESHEHTGVMAFNSLGGAGVAIDRSSFVENLRGLDTQNPGSLVTNCSFRGGVQGLQVSMGGSAIVTSCTFDDHTGAGLSIVGGSLAEVSELEFSPPISVCIVLSGILRGTDCLLGGGYDATLHLDWNSTIDFHHNHILNDGGWTTYAPGGTVPFKTFDLSDNYWGTTDTAQLDEWIYDRNDTAGSYIYIDYEPLLTDPVPTESMSFGELKARFGGQ